MNLVFYKTLNDDLLIQQFLKLKEEIDNQETKASIIKLSYEWIYQLINEAAHYGLKGNIWYSYLIVKLLQNENAYSLSNERWDKINAGMDALAELDFHELEELFDYTALKENLPAQLFSHVEAFEPIENNQRVWDSFLLRDIQSISEELSKYFSIQDLKANVTSFYKIYGTGKFGLHKAFRVESKKGQPMLIPITNIGDVRFEDLVGYESEKKKLIDNTEAFVNQRKANNCLLFGDAGTGKSTCIKALLNQYFKDGLRIIELYKHQFQDLNQILTQISYRNYKFIIYMDDLSFEEFETEYKYLKAVIEGGLQKKPENVLIYATSNRRHLVKEFFTDKEGRRDQLHASDTVSEKLSLAGRFGVTIFFSSPERREFENIVKVLAKKNGITMSEDELITKANHWELRHGGLSGRTAQQFIDYLLGNTSE